MLLVAFVLFCTISLGVVPSFIDSEPSVVTISKYSLRFSCILKLLIPASGISISILPLIVCAFTVLSVPRVKLSSMSALPPTLIFFSMPTPPSTTNAPVSLSALSVVFEMITLGCCPKVTASSPDLVLMLT